MRFALILACLALVPAALHADQRKQGMVTPPYYKSLAELQAALAAGRTSSVELTQLFLQRIQDLDRGSGGVNSIIELNPDALAIAAERDADRKAGRARGPLFGIPVLVKDNIDSADKMQTSAGSLALTGAPAPADATLVAKLRAAGAVLLGKTNLSEWANFRSTHATSGWSGRGGLTRNPYVLTRNACGSSSGSGAAVSSGLAAVALGTETDGSLTCPASVDGIVTIKPTLGLVSRSGIVPIAHSQDSAGPMTRSVADAAAVLTAIAGSDPRDPATAEADKHKMDYTRALQGGALKGKRIGVVCDLAGFNPDVDRILDRSAAELRTAGATVVPIKLPHVQDLSKPENTVLLYEFKHDLNAYLATRPGVPIKNLDDLVAYDKAHAAEEMPWFGQELALQAASVGPLTDKAYVTALADEKRMSGPEGIDAALKKDALDALMAPAGGPAWSTDLVNGDNFGGGGDGPAAVAGYPSVTVPAGNVHGLPVGVVFFASAWSEPKLIGMAYDFEQRSRARIEPQFLSDTPRETELASVAESGGFKPAMGDTPPVCPATPSP